MNFSEQMEEISNFKNFADVTREFDFLQDYEDLRFKQMFNTTLKKKRRTDFSDDELEILYDAFYEKVDELTNRLISNMSYKYKE